jgi:hypothetical protein
VSAEWLRRWADTDGQEPVDNTLLLCEHGALNPASLHGAARPLLLLAPWAAGL